MKIILISCVFLTKKRGKDVVVLGVTNRVVFDPNDRSPT